MNNNENETKYKSYIENAPDGVLVTDKTGRYIEVNKAASLITGYSKNELLHMSINDITSEEFQDYAAKHFAELIKTGSMHAIMQYKHKNGSTRWWTVDSVRLNQSSYLGFVKDITDKKNIEDALSVSELRYRRLFESAKDGILILDAETGEIIEVNPFLTNLLEYSRKELIEKKIWEIGAFKDVLANRENFLELQEKKYIRYDDLPLQTSKGEWVDVEFVSNVYPEGSKDVIQCNIRDITARKKAEALLKDINERYKFLFDHSGVGVGHYSAEGIVISYNNKAAENMGGHPEDFIGHSLYEIFPKHEADLYLSRIKEAQTYESPQEYEDMFLLPTGIKWFSSTFNKVLDKSGLSIGVQVISIDITGRKLAEIETKETKDYLEKLLNNANAPILVLNEKLEIIKFNSAFEILTGRKAEHVIGNTMKMLFPKEQSGIDIQSMINTSEKNKGKAIEVDIEHVDGSIRTILWNSATLFDAAGAIPVATIVQGQDISEIKKAEENLEYLSYHDQLTGLYNRRFFEAELVRLNVERNLPLTIIMGDINGLKLINDSLGHAMGDNLLKHVAQIFKKVCRADDIISRTGGDEFILLLPGTDEIQAKGLIERLQKRASESDEKLGDLSISFGYHTKKKKNEEIQEVLEKAENDMYRHKVYERLSFRRKTIEMVMNTLFEKSKREMAHSQRVSGICEKIAKKMSFSEDDIVQIKTAGLLHDIGKIGVEEHILNKPKKLNDYEWNEIMTHPEKGWRILNASRDFTELASFVLQHHEKWDGQGYPKGLKGKEISLQARIIQIADAYDTMTSERTYRKKLSNNEALFEIKECSGTQFDPEIVEIFLDYFATDSDV